jgi:hypothetical protein
VKKITPDPPEAPKSANPISHIFTIAPDVDTEAVLVYASETFVPLSAMTTDLAFELEGSAQAIQQLIVLGERWTTSTRPIRWRPWSIQHLPTKWSRSFIQ